MLKEKILFQNTSIIYDGIVNFNGDILVITFDTLPPYSVLSNGIMLLNENNFIIQGHYESYTTIYRRYEDNPNKIEFSNDGSVWIEPEPVPEPEPEPPYVPTLQDVKNNKISELSNICNRLIENGVDIEINGVMEHFSYGILSGDQGNIDDLCNMAQLTGLNQPYHCDGGGCKEYTPEQIVRLYVAQKINKASHTTYYNQLKSYIQKSFTTDEDKETIRNISYGQELTGEYLTTYNAMMEQSKIIVETAIAKMTSSISLESK